MFGMIWAILVFMVLFFIIFFTTIKIKIEYQRERENDVIYIEAAIWFGLLTFKFKIPMLQIQSLLSGVKVEQDTDTKMNKDTQDQKNKLRFTPRKLFRYLNRVYRLRKKVHDFNRIVKKTLKMVRCEHFEWHTRIGVGDAAATGVITGMVWGIKSIFVAVLSQYVTLQTEPIMNVVPAFQSEAIDTRFSCILRFRIGYAIIAGTRIVFKLRKGREGLWQSTLFRA